MLRHVPTVKKSMCLVYKDFSIKLFNNALKIMSYKMELRTIFFLELLRFLDYIQLLRESFNNNNMLKLIKIIQWTDFQNE